MAGNCVLLLANSPIARDVAAPYGDVHPGYFWMSPGNCSQREDAMTPRRGLAGTARKLEIPAAAMLAGGLLAGAVPASAAASLTTTTITKCTVAAFNAAVAKSGTVVFGLNCALTLPHSVKVPASKDLSISSGGFTVSLGGDNLTQLFSVTGGTLDISGLTLLQGVAHGSTGANGANGAAGTTGASGTPGAAGGSGGAGKTATAEKTCRALLQPSGGATPSPSPAS